MANLSTVKMAILFFVAVVVISLLIGFFKGAYLQRKADKEAAAAREAEEAARKAAEEEAKAAKAAKRKAMAAARKDQQPPKPKVKRLGE